MPAVETSPTLRHDAAAGPGRRAAALNVSGKAGDPLLHQHEPAGLRYLSRFATFASMRGAGGPMEPERLGPAERSEFERLRHPARREAWWFGRILARRLLHETAGRWLDDSAEIEILSRDEQGRAVRPGVRIGGRLMPWCLSIAHTDQAALVAVSFEPGTTVGVDLVRTEPVSRGFLETWFTKRERSWLDTQPAESVAISWGLKEALYKACQRGESFVPRRVEIFPDDSEGMTLMYNGIHLSSRCRRSIERFDGHVAVTVALYRLDPP
ncbi:MAG: 4'-phosphopantetheinyl transferase superfamily protein [Planctomycetes bacterium]|nr:4'-phosphopantetheinyl transferase superfamily protein [Planctomycetota bacterium]